MQRDDFQRFRAVMTGMAKVYERELDGLLLDAYWLALGSWSLEDFESGAAHLMRTSKFMPRPADFNELRKASLPTAGEAWAAVLEHLKAGTREWTDGGRTWDGGPTITAEIDKSVAVLGGYRALAMMPTKELPWMERRFAEHYGDLTEAAQRREVISGPGWLRLPAPSAPKQLT
jgi:hypothetical protein